jgi:3-dehydroquinate dehydratase type I
VPLICVAIMAETTEQTLNSVKNADQADLIEIRLDYRSEPLDLKAIRSATEKPLIATNRRKDQGGRAMESETERIQLLINAVDSGFEYVDIASTTPDLRENVAKLQALGAKVIASYHDFKNPLNSEQIDAKHIELGSSGCDVVKIVGWTNSYEDNLPYLEYNKAHPGNLSFGMGEKGISSRILAPLSGAWFTYASLEAGRELAPGQISLNSLRKTYWSLGL